MSDKSNTDNENTMYIPSEEEYGLPHLERIQQNRNSQIKPVKLVRKDENRGGQSTQNTYYSQTQQFNVPNQQNHGQQYFNPNQQNYNQSPQNYQNQQYFNPNQQNYNPNQQYYNPNPQNYNQSPQNYQNQQYFNPNQQNYNPNQQYYNPNPQNYNQSPQNYNPNLQNYQSQQYYNSNRQNYSNPQYHNSNTGQNNSIYAQPVQQNNVKKQPKKSKPRKQKKHSSITGKLLRKILWFLFTVFFVLFVMYSCTSLAVISKVNKVGEGERNRAEGSLSRSYVSSVLVIGTDGRSAEEQGRSDSMILFSLNRRTNQINMTSFMRDCYVEIQGYGWDKLNSAYSYGGAELLMDTIEHNFGVKIDDYVTVNFMSFTDIVDSVGGIDIEVTDEEAQEINVILQSEVNELMGDDIFSDFLDGGGKLHLNGKQALSFSRIRSVGNSDFQRTERQREVMQKILGKVTKPNPKLLVSLRNIIGNVMPKLNTNMSTWDMYWFSLKLPFAVRYDIQQTQVPYENTFYPADYDCGSVLVVDFESNYNILKDTVFGSSK